MDTTGKLGKLIKNQNAPYTEEAGSYGCAHEEEAGGDLHEIYIAAVSISTILKTG